MNLLNTWFIPISSFSYELQGITKLEKMWKSDRKCQESYEGFHNVISFSETSDEFFLRYGSNVFEI